MTSSGRSRGRKSALVALLLALGLTPWGMSVADYPDPEAPRLLSLYLRSSVEGVEEELSQFDFLVLPFKLLHSQPDGIETIRNLNPDQLLLVYTHGLFMSATPEGGPGDLHYDFYMGLDSLWVAYNEYGDSITFQNAIHVNFTEVCPEVGGMKFRDYFISFVRDRLFPYIEDGTIDGIYLDGMNENGYLWWDLYFPGWYDYDLNGVPDDPEQVLLWSRETINMYADSIAATVPEGGLVLGANCKPYQPAIHGKLYEGFPSEGEGELAGTLNSLDLWNSHGPAIDASALNGIPEYPEEMSEFRYRFTGSLLSDCYFSYDYDFWDHNQTEWFELFDFNLGLPDGYRYTLCEEPSVEADFEDGLDENILDVPGNSSMEITTDPDHVIDGDQSILVTTITEDPRPKLLEITNPGGYAAWQYYTVSFRYKILSCDLEETTLQMVATFSDACDLVYSAEVPTVAGAEGLMRVSLHLDGCDDYQIFLQVKEGMQLVIDNVTLVEGQGGLWARNYGNGLVVVNGSGSNQVLPFTPTWDLVDGNDQLTDYSLWQWGTSITMPNQDGLVFSYREPDLYINEFLTENVDLNRDEQGEFEDWIEIYNARDIPIILDGFTLTNDLSNRAMWTFPDNTAIDAGGFLLIWCDGETEEGPLHANFTLDAAGGEVGFYGPACTGSIHLDSHSFEGQSPDVSTGRETDGNEPWVTFDRPTPDASNHNVGVDDLPQGALQLLQNHPNPFNPKTRISFVAPSAGHARLEIFDLSGRIVAVLLDGPVSAGLNSLDWEGRDQDGRALASGVYFTRLQMEGKRSEGKMLMLR